MADFGWVLRQVRDGKCARRPSWKPGTYLYLAVPRLDGYVMTPQLVIASFNGLRSEFPGAHHDLLANDWELAGRIVR